MFRPGSDDAIELGALMVNSSGGDDRGTFLVIDTECF